MTDGGGVDTRSTQNDTGGSEVVSLPPFFLRLFRSPNQNETGGSELSSLPPRIVGAAAQLTESVSAGGGSDFAARALRLRRGRACLRSRSNSAARSHISGYMALTTSGAKM